MGKISVALCCILIVLTKTASAGFIHMTTADSLYVHEAQIRAYDVYIEGLMANGEYQVIGSGVYAGGNENNKVITAYHVAQGYLGFRVGFGDNYNTNRGPVYTSMRPADLNPGFIGLNNGPDTAIITLDQSVLGIPHANLYNGNPADLIGTVAHMGGYGITGTIGGTDTPFKDGSARVGTNIITGVNNGFITTAVRRPTSPNGLPLGILLGDDDSGSGWTTKVLDIDYLFAIQSTSGLLNAYNAPMSATIIDPWTTNQVTAVPEASSVLLSFLGIAYVILLRSRIKLS